MKAKLKTKKPDFVKSKLIIKITNEDEARYLCELFNLTLEGIKKTICIDERFIDYNKLFDCQSEIYDKLHSQYKKIIINK